MAIDWETVITAAAVGSLTSAAIGFVNQILERRSRRKELLLSRSLDLAKSRRESVLAMARDARERGHNVAPLWVPDDIESVETYYRWLTHLHDHGVLPKDAQAIKEENQREIAEAKKKIEDQQKASRWPPG